jgi:hypothetical protein
MKGLEARLRKLESVVHRADNFPLHCIIHNMGGGELLGYFASGLEILRKPGESERECLTRAEALAKKQNCLDRNGNIIQLVHLMTIRDE